MREFEELTYTLFADRPRGVLYHYTTLTGLLGIVNSRTLWASDIRYMNDSAELKHAGDLIRQEVQERITNGSHHPHLLGAFVDWVTHRITNGHLLFAASFRSHGNLLSQWRGYSSHGKGVSLGFSSDYILACAHRQEFQIGKCIYEPKKQIRLIGQVIDVIEHEVEGLLSGNEDRQQLTDIYMSVFERVEVDLLRIAAILKHPSFREEREWRVVSPVWTEKRPYALQFREANAMLVPYIEFDLVLNPESPILLDHLYLGPTSNINISMNSMRLFLGQNNIEPKLGIEYCQIPYRQR
ncbi:DUF2971 domain-containing protein [Desulfogranum japonicum]|uniref:DUF2971 domain-containing protein n=1 Tax=Desulfogranum japonicum TaxID=231447 RepID=UPI000417B487|nr:DUF2971 domain-containing protein [Desulfogranum japonicum]